jgi:transketolase
LPVVFIFTHDTVGVGEDGPTHQPVETCSGLRVIPGLDVARPSDPEEVVGSFVAALQRRDGPTALLLTRQNVPTLSEIPVAERRQGAVRGGYIAVRELGPLDCVLIATGSELSLAIAAARQLGAGTRVVSMPCCERFDRQPDDYRRAVLPPSCQRRVAIEAGVTSLWARYVGPAGRVVGSLAREKRLPTPDGA